MGVTTVTTSAGWAIEGVIINAGTIKYKGTAAAVVLDADGDTHLGASTDDQIDVTIAGSIDFVLTSNLFTISSGSAIGGSGSTFVPLIPIAAQQALSGAGAINITTYYTAWTTTGANAATLVNGVVKGQMKKIQMIVDADDGTLTPTTLTGGTTITFADVGDFVILCWDGTSWVPVELGNAADGVTAPVIA